MLETLKSLIIGIAPDASEDKDLDKKLTYLLSAASQRLKVLLGGLEPPEELEYIIIDVAAARFNRIGSEGLKSHTVEGEELTFNSNDFAGFADDIQAWLDSRKESERGKVRFI